MLKITGTTKTLNIHINERFAVLQVVGAAGQTHIIKPGGVGGVVPASGTGAGGMTGIAALAAAAAQQGKMVTSMSGTDMT